MSANHELKALDIVTGPLTFDTPWLGVIPNIPGLKKRLRAKRKSADPDAPFTFQQAAEHLGMSLRTLRGHVKDGSIRYLDVGRKASTRPCYRFTHADLDDFKTKHSKQETAPCPSSAKARRSITTTSKSGVLDFAALRAARASAKRKP